MSGAFGPEYSASYDALYADKDYDAECDLLERIFRRSGQHVGTVLDLGCGTGAHAVRLAQRGYEVVGVDLSAGMLDAAQRRADRAGPASVTFVRGDIRSVRLDRQFDAVIGMFAVLGYQTSDEDVARALETVRRHLAPGGRFVFDVWYGPAVEALGPSSRTKTVRHGKHEIERLATGVLEPERHLCTVAYRLTTRLRDGAAEVVSEETHRMRYFFREELEVKLRAASLTPLRMTSFPDTRLAPSADSWNVLVTASASGTSPAQTSGASAAQELTAPSSPAGSTVPSP